jgi:para-nitrobenzyl esterase
VVVTLNYRLGALGFLALPGAADDEGAANFGLLDQLAALAWVREHAAAFGGDPRRLTAFGNSAGAMSLGALLAAPRARGLFDRAILQSGAACHVSPPDVAERVAATFAAELGADAKDTATLRAAPLAAVLDAQARAAQKLRGVVRELPYQPVVDGLLLPRPPLDAIRDGEGAPVPLLVGTNADEWRFYGLSDPASRELDEAALLRRCRRNLPGVDAAGRERAERVVEVYRRARAERGEPTDPSALWFAIETDRWFRVPATRLLEQHRGPGWAYCFAWRSPQLGDAVGACHALEVPFVFGTLDGQLGRRLEGEDGRARVLSERMMDAWLAFAAAGVPRAPGLPEWPRYRAPLRTTLRFDAECRLEERPAEAERAVWDALA